MIAPLSLALLLVVSVSRPSACADYTFAEGLDIFTNLHDLVNYFGNHSDPLARRILDAFQRDCRYQHEPSFTDTTRKPFIVIIGDHRTTRESVGTRLAQVLAGRYMSYPPPCLYRYLNQIPKGTLLRRAFFFLSNYASAFYAKIQLTLGKAVVLNGYYWEQLTFSLINSFLIDERLPPIEHDLFTFPEDLLRPNLVFFLHLPDLPTLHNGTTPSSLVHWRPRTLQLYRRMTTRHPNIVMMETSKIHQRTVSGIYNYIRHRLYHIGGVWVHDHPAGKQ